MTTQPNRERLPDRRSSETFNIEINGRRYGCTISQFADGRLGEIFLSNNKVDSQRGEGQRQRVLDRIAVWRGCRNDGRASGPLGVALNLLANPRGE
jgi:hypothetical protein